MGLMRQKYKCIIITDDERPDLDTFISEASPILSCCVEITGVSFSQSLLKVDPEKDQVHIKAKIISIEHTDWISEEKVGNTINIRFKKYCIEPNGTLRNPIVEINDGGVLNCSGNYNALCMPYSIFEAHAKIEGIYT